MASFIGVVSASTFFLESDNESLIETLYQNLRYDEPEFQKNPYSKWDGSVRMFKKENGTFPSGLLHKVLIECKDFGEQYELDPIIKTFVRDVKHEDIQAWVDKLPLTSGGEKITAYDYQVRGLYLSILHTRYLAKAATSAGKSLLQYLLCRFWRDMYADEGKILIVVPTLQLTHQLYSDFCDYSSTDPDFDAEALVHVAGDGVSPLSRKRIVICTWQTLVKQSREFFHSFNFLMGDEAHTFSSESLKYIAENCINAYQRIGLTGTIKEDEGHKLRVIQHFGSIQTLITSKELRDRGLATQTKVHILKVEYDSTTKKMFFEDRDYKKEMQYLCEHPWRNKLITNLGFALEGNSLFLFEKVDGHLMLVRDQMIAAGLQPYIIHGDVPSHEREEIKQKIERGENIILLATYGTTSTGISIKKLHNLIFCGPTKSFIRVVQSIGRMLRLHSSKDISNIYDIVDIAKYSGRPNKAMEWADERIDIYASEQHETKIISLKVPTLT